MYTQILCARWLAIYKIGKRGGCRPAINLDVGGDQVFSGGVVVLCGVLCVSRGGEVVLTFGDPWGERGWVSSKCVRSDLKVGRSV